MAVVRDEKGLNDSGLGYYTSKLLQRIKGLIDSAISALNIAQYLKSSDAESTYVQKDGNKGLSTNDYTDTDKSKLSQISSGAQVNVIESIKVNNATQAITNKSVNISVPSKNNGHFNTVTHGAILFCATRLKCFVIPEGITAIANNFTNTNSEIVLIFPKTITAFGGETTGLRNTDSIIFPSGVTTLTQTPIRYCRKTRRIYIPNGVASFSDYYLGDTYSLQELHLPINENFKTLPQAFLFYTGLRYLEIPASITTMNNLCCCSFALEEVIMRPVTPPTAATINIFPSSTARLKIYVPYSSDHSILDAYKTTTNWTQFASKIYELDENGNIPKD